MALGAVLRGERFGNREAPMLFRWLTFDGMVAIQTVDTPDRVLTPFELVDDGRGLMPMAFGALACGFDERRSGLAPFDPRPPRVHEERCDHESRGEDHGDEDALERHRARGPCKVSTVYANSTTAR